MAAPEGQIRRLSVADFRLLKPNNPRTEFFIEHGKTIKRTLAVSRFLASLAMIAVAVNQIRTGRADNNLEKL